MLRANAHVILLLFLMKILTCYPLLIGPIGYKDIQLVVADMKTARKFYKHKQITSITSDAQEDVIQQYGLAKVWCKEHLNDKEAHVSLFHHKEENFLSYSILYTQSATMPPIVTLKAIINDPDSNCSLSIREVNVFIASFCKRNSMFLQTHDLKTWANGKTKRIMFLDSCFDENDAAK